MALAIQLVLLYAVSVPYLSEILLSFLPQLGYYIEIIQLNRLYIVLC